MTIYSGTVTHYTTTGKALREDLADIVYMLKPMETPLVSAIGRSTASQPLHQWPVDSLDAAAANVQLDGDDAPAGTSVTAAERNGNYCQISRKVVVVSGTTAASTHAGGADQKPYLVAKRGLELRRDIEFTASQTQIGVLGNATTARQTAGWESWMVTNNVGTPGASPANRGTGGTDPSLTSGIPAVAAGDGTLRNLDEAMLKNVLQQIYTSGGHPSLLIAPPLMKQRISGFTGTDVALTTSITRTNEMGKKELTAAIDVYVSDFGSLNVQPSRFMRTVNVHVVDPEYAAIAYLRPIQSTPLAKTGDAEKILMLAEWCLEMRNEKAQGILADLQ